MAFYLALFPFLNYPCVYLDSQSGTFMDKYELPGQTKSNTSKEKQNTKLISYWNNKHIMTTLRVNTDHQNGVVTERVTWQCGEVGIMLEDGTVVWMPAALTPLCRGIPSCSHRVQTLHKVPQGDIHPTAQRLQRNSLWKRDTRWHNSLTRNKTHAQQCTPLILWTIIWYILRFSCEQDVIGQHSGALICLLTTGIKCHIIPCLHRPLRQKYKIYMHVTQEQWVTVMMKVLVWGDVVYQSWWGWQEWQRFSSWSSCL